MIAVLFLLQHSLTLRVDSHLDVIGSPGLHCCGRLLRLYVTFHTDSLIIGLSDVLRRNMKTRVNSQRVPRATSVIMGVGRGESLSSIMGVMGIRDQLEAFFFLLAGSH